jgi:hypothetical protein
MAEPPLAFRMPCVKCKTEVVASVALLRHARGYKCPSCAEWTDIDAATVTALERDFEPALADVRRRLGEA